MGEDGTLFPFAAAACFGMDAIRMMHKRANLRRMLGRKTFLGCMEGMNVV